MFECYRLLSISLIILVVTYYGDTQDNCWCCAGAAVTLCNGGGTRMIVNSFAHISAPNLVSNLHYVNTTDVMLEPYTFFNASLLSVTILSISHTPLHIIADGTFSGLSSLQNLLLQSNALDIFTVGNLEGVNPSTLEIINLRDNQISYLSSNLMTFFSSMPDGSVINLMDNPLVCDCHLSWMLQLPSTVSVVEAKCMEPATFHGQYLTSLTAASLNALCPGVCSTPIHNCPVGTVCSQINDTLYECICQSGVAENIDCIDINECLLADTCDADLNCINTKGSYLCCTPMSVVNITTNQCQQCPQGSIANISSNQCQQCPDRSIVNTTNNDCQECSERSIADRTNNQCQECPLGSIVNITLNQCQECPQGSIVDRSGTQCQKCPQGSIANTTRNNCQQCPERSVVVDNQCRECSPGSIANITCQTCPLRSIVVDNQCQECPAGYFANITDNHCQPCPPGTISDAATNQCQACHPRSIAVNNQCQPCQQGSIVVNNQCQVCPQGSIVNTTSNRCQQCQQGSIADVMNNHCESCPQGSIVINNQCQACPQGSIVNTTNNRCQQCQQGSIADVTNNRCQLCPQGSIVVNNQCQACPQGSIVNLINNGCQQCQQGSIANITNNQCESCPQGSIVENNQCQTCPDNLMANIITNQCVGCPIGEEYDITTAMCVTCSSQGMTYDSSEQACQFCPSQTQFDLLTDSCQPCPSSTIYNSIDHVCVECSGNTVPNDDHTSCIPCGHGTVFSDMTGTCQPCPNMTEYNSTTMTCVTCAINTQYNFNTRSCEVCPPAKLYNGECVQCGLNNVVNTVTGECEPCPEGLEFNMTTAECDCPCANNLICLENFCICPIGMINDTQRNECVNASDSYCNATVLDGVVWPSTNRNKTRTHPCPYRTDQLENRTRTCGNDGNWEDVNDTICPSRKVVQLWESSSILTADISENDLERFTDLLVESFPANLTSGDILVIHNLLETSVSLFSNVNNSEVANEIAHDIVMVLSKLFSNDSQTAWGDISNARTLLTTLTETLDSLGRQLVTFAGDSNDNRILVNAEGIVLQVLSISINTTEDIINISLPSLNSPDGLSFIELSTDVLREAVMNNVSCELGVVSTAIEDLGSLLPPEDSTAPPPPEYRECGVTYSVPIGVPVVNSVVLSTFVASPNCQVNTSVLKTPVIITLQHDILEYGDPQCVFLDTVNSDWSGRGCMVVQRGANFTVCQCNHLTSFAIVMNPEGAEVTHEHGLKIASKIGMGLSIIALIVSILMLFGLKTEDRTYLQRIHGNFALALCFAQTVFLVGVDRRAVPSPEEVCTVIAILLHYLLLATWAWMLVEGVHLYMMLVKIFYNRKIFYFYVTIAWTAPIVVVAITLGSRLEDYGTECLCWIDSAHGSIWSFHGPVIAILVINLLILCGTTVIAARAQRKVDDAVKATFRAALILLPLLGITWALGFLVVLNNAIGVAIEWLFFSFNTLQGVIFFILYCLSNRDLRLAFMKKFGCRQVAIDIERDIPWTRRPSMQISSALRSARRSSIIESLVDSSRRSSFGDSSRRSSWRGSDSSGSKNDDSFYAIAAGYNHSAPRPSLLISRLHETLAEEGLEDLEMELTEADEIDVGIDPATGEVLQNPSPDQPPQYTTDILPNDNTTNDN
ncbi:cadherin EGF LAG seven-pass G-type receptor 3-like [Dysidea avara]|uniref:cadherin EGF LAG seven-pass G-type receptor 3-like n=1 Tax=Dysidea avara TaxID=196820 RepID=UPI0033334025